MDNAYGYTDTENFRLYLQKHPSTNRRTDDGHPLSIPTQYFRTNWEISPASFLIIHDPVPLKWPSIVFDSGKSGKHRFWPSVPVPLLKPVKRARSETGISGKKTVLFDRTHVLCTPANQKYLLHLILKSIFGKNQRVSLDYSILSKTIPWWSYSSSDTCSLTVQSTRGVQQQ